jgi:hypothetical protein
MLAYLLLWINPQNPQPLRSGHDYMPFSSSSNSRLSEE